LFRIPLRRLRVYYDCIQSAGFEKEMMMMDILFVFNKVLFKGGERNTMRENFAEEEEDW